MRPDRPSPRGTVRPTLARATLGLVLALVLLALATVDDAAAAVQWCRTDPVVSIGGDVVDIFVAAPPTAPLKVTGPNQVVVVVPTGVPAHLVLKDLGFGKGEVVTFEESAKLKATEDGIEVVVKVLVPASEDDMPVRVEVAPRVVGVLSPASAEGTANDWIRLRTTL